MHTRIVLLILLAALVASCKSVDCGDGTIERNGACVPANETFGTLKCGTGTMPQGDLCVSILPPTVCDPETTLEDVDSMGVITCIGTGGGGCSAKLACPAPTDGKQTICGQIYDFETNQPFAQAGATGARCPPPPAVTTGPCALGIRAYDAVQFATMPTTATPLTTDPFYIDDCGRYRLAEIMQPGPPGLIALGFDDAIPQAAGPAGVTNAVGVATGAVPNSATKDFEAFIARKATTDTWVAASGPNIGTGFYVPVFRGHRTGTDLVAGVTVTFGPMATLPASMDTNRDFYFASDATTRLTLSAGANATGVNGTALFSSANLGEVYSGAGGGLPPQCRWDIHGGASVSGVVFIQLFRPINNGPTATCPL